MARWEDIVTLSRCCDAPPRVVCMADLNHQWQAHECTGCGNPCRTYNVLKNEEQHHA